MTEPYELPQRPRTDAWIERVRAADAEAEAAFALAYRVRPGELDVQKTEERQLVALIAIASELRAQRIARRPGAGR